MYRNTPVSLSSWRSSTQFPTRVPCSSRLLKPVKGSSSFDIVAESATGSGTSRSSPVHVRDWLLAPRSDKKYFLTMALCF